MRVTFLTHYYPPEVGAPQARISALAELLSGRGAEVTVHTGFPHYPDGKVKPPYRNRPWQVEREGPVTVVRSVVHAAPNRGFARRLADHTTFALGAIATQRLSGPADVVVAESPPLFTAAAGVTYAGIKRAPLVLNVADRWPASAVALGALNDRRAIAAAEGLERWCYRRAAAITAPTAGVAAALRREPAAAGKVVEAPPSVDVELFEAGEPGAGGPFRVLYAGTVGMAQGVDTLIDAATVLAEEEIEVEIAGDGAEAPELRRRLEREPLPRVSLLGPVPHDAVPALYAGADAAVVLLRDRPIFEEAVPTKLLEAMAAARPIVLAARGEAARLVENHGAGLVVPPEDPDALAAALRRLAGDRSLARELGHAGRRCAVERFARPVAAEQWWRLLSGLAGSARSGAG